MKRIKPEIMSPVGYYPQLYAAIEAGADAVYFGLKHFTARAKVGFTLAELPDVMRTLHMRGVKGYLTFNTLVFDHELSEAVKTLEAIAHAQADAVIVQDVGIAQLARQIAPDMAIHGSTQMSITSAEGVAWAQRFGVDRVVLARELALTDIRTIAQQTDVELEMFVHGALCVSYSGQCFSSEAWGGRSANRGQCAQACRLPYELWVDDQHLPLGEARYLLSPGDLYALHQVSEIVELGITTLKIEGRYKEADYVALTTHAYRQAVDAAWENRPNPITPSQELELEQVYSRGLGAYFVSGTNHQAVVSGRSPRHRGVLCGKVQQVQVDHVVIEPTHAHELAPLKAGDGVVFDAADWRSPEQPEEGGHLYEVRPLKGNRLALYFGNWDVQFGRVRKGDWVWRTHDVQTAKSAKHFTQASQPVHKQGVQVEVIAEVGQPLLMHWSLVKSGEVRVSVQSDEPLQRANQNSMTREGLIEQLNRLGNTPYELASLQATLTGEPFVPNALLNRLRREAVEALIAQQAQPRSVHTQDALTVLDQALASATHVTPVSGMPSLHVLVRTPEQLEAVLPLRPASITLDYLELYGLRPSVERIKEAGIVARVASPRILKPQEQRVVNFLLRLECDLLVRSGGLLEALQGRHPYAVIGDFSLNTANQLTAESYFKLGVNRLTPTHDLNAEQIRHLAQQIGGDRFEVVAYHHLAVFHMEHCVFCRFLSKGTSYQDCGHPCEQHKVALRDGQGRAHPVMADVGCRNTVFGAEAQVASKYLDRWREAGIVHYRLEFVHETASEVQRVTRAFQEYLRGELSALALDERLRKVAPQGTSEGSFFVPLDYIHIPNL
ncbi:MAG: DUF3656 domain-containing U32 family peptidase [Phototrophicaceae bacterium]